MRETLQKNFYASTFLEMYIIYSTNKTKLDLSLIVAASNSFSTGETAFGKYFLNYMK